MLWVEKCEESEENVCGEVEEERVVEGGREEEDREGISRKREVEVEKCLMDTECKRTKAFVIERRTLVILGDVTVSDRGAKKEDCITNCSTFCTAIKAVCCEQSVSSNKNETASIVFDPVTKINPAWGDSIGACSSRAVISTAPALSD